MLRLAPFTGFTFALVMLAGCSGAVVAQGTGGGGTTSGTTTTTSSTTTTTSANGCAAAGGTCVAIVPDACQLGTWADPSLCGGGDGVGCCVANAECANPCDNVGESRCVAGAILQCVSDGTCDHWIISAVCTLDGGCNSDGTKCASAATTCTLDSECGCGCGCLAGQCECTGALPPMCQTDQDCGPACSGNRCENNVCVTAKCQPGADQTCNDNPAMSALAGQCGLDAQCTCNPGYEKKPSGLCG